MAKPVSNVTTLPATVNDIKLLREGDALSVPPQPVMDVLMVSVLTASFFSHVFNQQSLLKVDCVPNTKKTKCFPW